MILTSMTFHLIARTAPPNHKPFEIPRLFAAACEKLGVPFVMHDVRTLDLSALAEVPDGDMVYRAALGQKALITERLMVGEKTATFRKNWWSVVNTRGCSYFIHEKIGIPVIPTVPFIPDTDEEVAKMVEHLGDFPIIVKALGGSHGVGVIRVDSLQSLKSLLDYLRQQRTQVLIRKYIHHNYYGRLVVIGDAVVASHITYALNDEFRTNAGEDARHEREAKVFPQAVQDIAVRAVHALGLETGGVDILFDDDGGPHLAEVNFPNDFSTTQKITGIDIAEAMVGYLLKKAGER